MVAIVVWFVCVFALGWFSGFLLWCVFGEFENIFQILLRVVLVSIEFLCLGSVLLGGIFIPGSLMG